MAKQYIMLHHSLTEDGKTVSWGAIERYHKETQHWRDIGYHYGVELIGDSHYALLGRPEDQDAAACKEGQMNQRAIHICCVGNYDVIRPSDETLHTLVTRVLIPVMKRNNIHPGNIIGHRDYAPYKTCPGTQFNLSEVRRLTMQQWGV